MYYIIYVNIIYHKKIDISIILTCQLDIYNEVYKPIRGNEQINNYRYIINEVIKSLINKIFITNNFI